LIGLTRMPSAMPCARRMPLSCIRTADPPDGRQQEPSGRMRRAVSRSLPDGVDSRRAPAMSLPRCLAPMISAERGVILRMASCQVKTRSSCTYFARNRAAAADAAIRLAATIAIRWHERIACAAMLLVLGIMRNMIHCITHSMTIQSDPSRAVCYALFACETCDTIYH
jgi:hypothetical protein